jgi:hypothetical protein
MQTSINKKVPLIAAQQIKLKIKSTLIIKNIDKFLILTKKIFFKKKQTIKELENTNTNNSF